MSGYSNVNKDLVNTLKMKAKNIRKKDKTTIVLDLEIVEIGITINELIFVKDLNSYCIKTSGVSLGSELSYIIKERLKTISIMDSIDL